MSETNENTKKKSLCELSHAGTSQLSIGAAIDNYKISDMQ